MSEANKNVKTTEKHPSLPKNVVEEIAVVAAKTAVETYEARKKKDAEDRDTKKFRNTKLLLQKYRWLQEYAENAIYKAEQLAEEDDEILGILGLCPSEARKVESIKNSLITTRLIMSHIEIMLQCYKAKCQSARKPEQQRRWRIVYRMYISPSMDGVQTIADDEHVSVSQVYYDIDSACDDLKQLFFGIDLSMF